MHSPLMSPHSYHPRLVDATRDECVHMAPEAALALRHFSGSSLHARPECGSTGAGTCDDDDALDWMAPILQRRISHVVRGGNHTCDEMSTAASGSGQWLVGGTAAVEGFGVRCLHPHAPLTTVWQRTSGTDAGTPCDEGAMLQPDSLSEYLDELHRLSPTVKEFNSE